MPRNLVIRDSKRLLALATLVLLAMSATSCSKMVPTAPETALPGASSGAASRLATPATTTSSLTWNLLASRLVNRADDVVVSGGRYQLHFVRGSVGAPTLVTLSENDPLRVDFLVGPLGTVCGKAGVTVTIDYAGTNADPTATGFLMSSPTLWRLNEVTGVWEAMSGTDDRAAKKFTAKVSLLCRYALSFDSPGKGGW